LPAACQPPGNSIRFAKTHNAKTQIVGFRLESTATAKHIFTIPPVRFGKKFKNKQQDTLQPKS
jgi:hypothetical protein